MAKIIVDTRTDENGYFGKTVAFNASRVSGTTVALSATLLSPFATALWGSVRVEAPDAKPGRDVRSFVLWHSETMQLGSWAIERGDNIIVLHGKTNPARANTRILLEIDATP